MGRCHPIPEFTKSDETVLQHQTFFFDHLVIFQFIFEVAGRLLRIFTLFLYHLTLPARIPATFLDYISILDLYFK